MDPLKEGDKIFKTVAESFPWTHTEDINEAKKFLDQLVRETKGLVILDFMDMGSWDIIHGVEVRDEYLFLHWRDYRNIEESEDRMEIRKMAFPADLYSGFLHFSELRIERTDVFPFIFLRGFAIKDKEIKKLIGKGASQFKIYDTDNNFSKRVVAERENHYEVYDCLNTPIFSIVILPKNCGGSSGMSKQLLLTYNLHDSVQRLD